MQMNRFAKATHSLDTHLPTGRSQISSNMSKEDDTLDVEAVDEDAAVAGEKLALANPSSQSHS